MSISTDTTIAKRIIDKFSTDHVSVRERSLTKDRVALTTTVGANTDTKLNAVVTNFDKGEIDGTEILANDLKIIAVSQSRSLVVVLPPLIIEPESHKLERSQPG